MYRRNRYRNKNNRYRKGRYNKWKLFYTFRFKYGFGPILYKFRAETGKSMFMYEDFIDWYKQNWWRFHKKPLASQTIGRMLRLFAEFGFVIRRVGTKGRKVIFSFIKS